MKKEKVVEKRVTETEYICDRCGEKITHMYASRQCEICGRDVCQKCSYWFEMDWSLLSPHNFSSDHPDACCVVCWNDGAEIRKKIMESRDQQETEEYDLIQEWKKLCKGAD
jgi:ribosomal protein L37E